LGGFSWNENRRRLQSERLNTRAASFGQSAFKNREGEKMKLPLLATVVALALGGSASAQTANATDAL
jgi:hypothetical protein